VFVVLIGVLLVAVAGLARAYLGTPRVYDPPVVAYLRTTPVYDPPVLAGQVVSCTAGFYARDGANVVLTISDHCYDRANPPRDAGRHLIGTYGLEARRSPCPEGRTCAGSDIIELVLTPDHIPWGHLNEVDLGPGGYRVLEAGAAPLWCADLHEGMAAEANGRGIYRSGHILGVEPYSRDSDTIFPCMAVTDLPVGVGDSGGAVFADDRPAGITARSFADHLGFTPLAEGLADLGLTLCTEPDCGLRPPAPPP
jgi:hypothetical protein